MMEPPVEHRSHNGSRPEGCSTNPTVCQSTPLPNLLHCGAVRRFLIGADLKGESNVTLMKDMAFKNVRSISSYTQLQKCFSSWKTNLTIMVLYQVNKYVTIICSHINYIHINLCVCICIYTTQRKSRYKTLLYMILLV